MRQLGSLQLLVAVIGWFEIAHAQPIPENYDPRANRATGESASTERAAAAQRRAEAERQRREAAEAKAAAAKLEAAKLYRQLAVAKRQAVDAQKAKGGTGGTPSDSASPKVLRDKLADGSLGPEMVEIPVGSFEMGTTDGDADEKPLHTVRIAKPFALAKTEVTVDAFRAFVKTTGYKTDAEGGTAERVGCRTFEENADKWRENRYWDNPGFEQKGTQPVVCVSWKDAKDYAQWLSQQTGKDYRLPSEAQWEYAARAGTTTAYYWGSNANAACSHANVADLTTGPKGIQNFTTHDCIDGFFFTAPVASFKANGFGLHDMLGNVWEWTDDIYHDSYHGAPTDGSVWRNGSGAGPRVLRGGSWHFYPNAVRAAERHKADKADRFFGDRFSYVGFRLARTIP